MINKQAFFISGMEDPQTASGSAFGAMIMFVVTFVFSLYGIYYESAKAAELEAEGSEGYQLNTGAPEYGSRMT